MIFTCQFRGVFPIWKTAVSLHGRALSGIYEFYWLYFKHCCFSLEEMLWVAYFNEHLQWIQLIELLGGLYHAEKNQFLILRCNANKMPCIKLLTGDHENTILVLDSF